MSTLADLVRWLVIAAIALVPPYYVFQIARTFFISINNPAAYMLEFAADLVAGTLALMAFVFCTGAARSLLR